MSKTQPLVEQLTAPLMREHMPSSTEISLSAYLGRQKFGDAWAEHENCIPNTFGPSQAMNGFEDIYPNIIDYIVRITHRIWEDRDIEYIGETYSSNSYVFDDYGLQRGNQKIIADTYATTSAFSDIQLIADDIIWAGNDEVGYHTSHRTYMIGTNDGDSKFGPATNKRVKIPLIANCVAKDNKIYLEHVLYNASALIQQLGFDLNQTAKRMVRDKSTPGWPRDQSTWQSLRGAGKPQQAISASQPISGFDPDVFCRAAFDCTLGYAKGSKLDTFYHPNAAIIGPSNREFSSIEAYEVFLSAIQTALEVTNAQVDEVYWMGNDSEGYLASLRWSIDALHCENGIFGEASNKDLQFWGINQYFIINGKIEKECMMFNELDLLMQTFAE